MSTLEGKPQKRYSVILLRVLIGITLFLLAMHVLFQYLNWEVFYQQNGQVYELANRFDLDDEVSVPSWFSQFLFMVIGAGALLTAYLQPKKISRRLWQIIGVIGIAASVDESAGLHEFVLQTLHVIFFEDAGPTEVDNAWLIVLPFILLAGIWLVWRMFKVLPRRTIFLFVFAGVIFLSGAIGVDILTSITERESFLNQGALTGVEETLELFASVVVLYAVADYLERYHAAQIKSIAGAIRLAKVSR